MTYICQGETAPLVQAIENLDQKAEEAASQQQSQQRKKKLPPEPAQVLSLFQHDHHCRNHGNQQGQTGKKVVGRYPKKSDFSESNRYHRSLSPGLSALITELAGIPGFAA